MNRVHRTGSLLVFEATQKLSSVTNNDKLCMRFRISERKLELLITETHTRRGQ